MDSLLRVCRAGSRTVLCDPPGPEPALELARHGYRLLVLHNGDFEVDALRRSLRDSGLSSGLMGSHVYHADRPAQLAPEFYELWVFCAAPSAHLLQAAAGALKKGAPVFWPERYGEPPGVKLLDGPPKGWLGGRPVFDPGG